MSTRKITVTISGPQGAGKTRLADLIEDALCNCEATAVADANAESRAIWRKFGSEIHIVEKQVY